MSDEDFNFSIAEINQCIIKLQRFLQISRNIEEMLAQVSQKQRGKSPVDDLIASMLRGMGLKPSEIEEIKEAVKKQLPKEVVYGTGQNSG